MSVFWVGGNLGRTICANTPESWVADDNTELPMWLDQNNQPQAADLANTPESLWRTTYARNLPFVYFDDDMDPLGFVLGPTTYPVPMLGPDEKTSLAAMHGSDYARLFTDVSKNGQPSTTKQVSSRRTAVLDRGLHALVPQSAARRPTAPGVRAGSSTPGERPAGPWAFTERSAIQPVLGSGRTGPSWTEQRLSPDPEIALHLTNLLSVVEGVRAAMYSPMRIACEGRAGRQDGDPVLLESAQTSFYAEVEEPLTRVRAGVVDGAQIDWRGAGIEIGRVGSRVFDASTECLTAPTTLPQVSLARTRFRTRVRRVIDEVYSLANTTDRKGSVT
ncbi:MAG: hypothetical protein WKF76_02240 [Nocardioidaceae bacterium]